MTKINKLYNNNIPVGIKEVRIKLMGDNLPMVKTYTCFVARISIDHGWQFTY